MSNFFFFHNVFRSSQLLMLQNEYLWSKGLVEKHLLVLCRIINPLPDDKILDSSKLKEFADDNFKFDENGRNLSKRVENTVGKGKIARYEQFSFSHSVFIRFVSQGRQKASLCGNGLTILLQNYLAVVIDVG